MELERKMHGLKGCLEMNRTTPIAHSSTAHLRDLAELLGHQAVLLRGRPQSDDRTPSLQARISDAFRTRYMACFLADCGPEFGSRSVA